MDRRHRRRARRGRGLATEAGLRAWLDARGVHGYAQMVVVMERLGYPDHFLRSGDELVAAQYADRPALRPVLDAVLDAAAGLDPLTLQARKGYLSLVARRQLAVVRPTTRTRVDLGLRLDEPPGGRLLAAGGLANETISVRVALHTRPTSTTRSGRCCGGPTRRTPDPARLRAPRTNHRGEPCSLGRRCPSS